MPGSAGTKTVADGATLREGLGSRVFWIVVTVLFLSSIAQNGALTHLAALLTDRGVSAAGTLAAVLIGLGMGGEADATPYILSQYFGLRSFAMLYGFTWTAYAMAGAIGPVLMGKAFDMTASSETLLVALAVGTLGAGALMWLMPGYDRPARVSSRMLRTTDLTLAGRSPSRRMK